MADIRTDKWLLTFTVHRARNLPKADVLGKIDPYIVVHYDGQNIGKTETVHRDFYPHFKKTFRVHTPKRNATWELFIYDHDKITKDDLVGGLSIGMPDTPVLKQVAKVNVEKGLKPHHKDQPCEVVYSIGWVRDMDQLEKVCKQLNPDAKFHEKRCIAPIGDKVVAGGKPNDFLLCAEMEGDCVDIKLWSTVKDSGKLMDLSYACSGMKYKARKRNWPQGHKIPKSDLLMIFSEVKLDDVPYCFDFGLLMVTVSDAQEVFHETAERLAVRHGWISTEHGPKAKLGYKEFKSGLSNVYHDDKHKVVGLLETQAVFQLDWNSDSISYKWSVYQSAFESGLTADLVPNSDKKCQERVLHFYSKPRAFERQTGKTERVSMGCALDDANESTAEFQSMELFLYQRKNTVSVQVAAFFPFQQKLAS